MLYFRLSLMLITYEGSGVPIATGHSSSSSLISTIVHFLHEQGLITCDTISLRCNIISYAVLTITQFHHTSATSNSYQQLTTKATHTTSSSILLRFRTELRGEAERLEVSCRPARQGITKFLILQMKFRDNYTKASLY
ncbi:hypothetical protein Y032_0180g776 [Ancylostoma ceylanicum]|uniref:Uncharacterized protein n=1 Tax=Ancylostoma ceylanicum TaxID=53326 RepID=A0A016SSU1_9BILA|nr:hypothetical protein Y032_0180g776 [Ancylostoma ceylanicum]